MKQIGSTLLYFEFRINDENGNNKTINSNGEFTMNGESLGGEDGIWLNKTRFAIHIPQWKGWWVGMIVYDDKDKVKGMNTCIVEKNVNNPPNDVNTVELNNFESGYLHSNAYLYQQKNIDTKNKQTTDGKTNTIDGKTNTNSSNMKSTKLENDKEHSITTDRMHEVNIQSTSVSMHVVIIVKVLLILWALVSLTGVIITIYYQGVLLNYLYSGDYVKAFGISQNGEKDNLVVWLNIDSKQLSNNDKDELLNGYTVSLNEDDHEGKLISCDAFDNNDDYIINYLQLKFTDNNKKRAAPIEEFLNIFFMTFGIIIFSLILLVGYGASTYICVNAVLDSIKNGNLQNCCISVRNVKKFKFCDIFSCKRISIIIGAFSIPYIFSGFTVLPLMAFDFNNGDLCLSLNDGLSDTLITASTILAIYTVIAYTFTAIIIGCVLYLFCTCIGCKCKCDEDWSLVCLAFIALVVSLIFSLIVAFAGASFELIGTFSIIGVICAINFLIIDALNSDDDEESDQ